MRARFLLRALALAAVLTCGCPAKRATTSAPAAFDHVDFTGCAAIVAGPTCEVSRDRALVIAPPPEATDVAIAFAVGAADLVPATSEGSRARRVTIPTGAREIVVRGKEAGRVVEWRLALREATPEPAVVTEARELRAKGALDDAARTLTEQIAVLEGASRALALSALARVEIARGASDAAREQLGAAMDAHAAVGRFSTAADDATVLVFLLLEQRRFADARKTLARASEWSKDYYDGRVQVRFYEGYLARDTGDVRTALAKLDGAIADADAMSLARISGIMRMERALTHAEIGRVDEALGALRDLESIEGASACDRGLAALNIGWIALGARDGEIVLGEAWDARAALERALATFRAGCRDVRNESNALTNLAWAWLQAGDVASARATLSDARAAWAHPDSEVALFWVELEGRIALAEKRYAAALALFDRLARLASVSGARGDAWRAADGRAAALAALGKRADAVAASAEAERLLEEESRGVPLGEGRSQFLGARERSARRRVEILLDAGDPATALAAARAARGRVLADAERLDRVAALTPDARARWEVSLGAYRAERDALARAAVDDWSLSSAGLTKAIADRAARESKLRAALDDAVAALPATARASTDLPARGSGVVVVAYFPLLRGWAAFASDGAETIAVRVASIDPSAAPDALGRTLLDPLKKLVARASRVRVVALGPLDAIDLHAISFDDQPLVAHATVEYALDLSAAATPAPRGTRALVVADPTNDLRAARDEGRAIAGALGARGAVTLLEGPAATRPAVQAALASADLFHYAGHGVFGGRDGWASALPLADGVPLGVADILALPRAPREVLLAGCDTARSAHSTSSGIGVAQAFLAVGSDAVVASTREIDDAASAELLAALHRARADDPTRDLASALREAQLTVGARRGPGAWSAFRVLRR